MREADLNGQSEIIVKEKHALDADIFGINFVLHSCNNPPLRPQKGRWNVHVDNPMTKIQLCKS